MSWVGKSENFWQRDTALVAEGGEERERENDDGGREEEQFDEFLCATLRG